jgi:hypothetical protein
MLGATRKSLKTLGKGTSATLGKPSTTQKVLAGTSLGVRYLVKKLAMPKAGAEAGETATRT